MRSNLVKLEPNLLSKKQAITLLTKAYAHPFRKLNTEEMEKLANH